MKRSLENRTLAWLVLLVVLTPYYLQAQAGQGGFRIAGKVVNSITGAPLSRAVVTITNVRNPRESYSGLTADDGVFSFPGLHAGKFSLEGARRGFITANYEQHETYSTAIVTGAGIETEALVLRLTPEAVIAGRILDEFGEPVRDAQVHLYGEGHNTGVTRIQRRGQSTTDDQGKYEFADLPSGDYFISVTAKPWYALRPASTQMPDGKPLPTAIDSSLDVVYPTTFYADVTDSGDATPIPLRGGERLSIDIHVAPAQALRLTFHVAGGSDRGFSVPILRRHVFDTTEFVPPESVSMVSPGVVEISGIPAGKYTVMFPERGGGRPGKGADVDVTTNGQELDANKDEGFTTVTFSAQVPGVQRMPSGIVIGLTDSDRHMVGQELVNPDGQVIFSGVAPGKYTVLASAQGMGYAVTRIVANGVQTSGHSLEVSPDVPVTATLTLAGGSGNVEGVAQRDGKPSAGAMIVLVPKDPENNRELFLRDQSDLDGSFTLPNVVPGAYTVVAIENGWDLDWSQPGVIAHYVPKGQVINVGAGAEGPLHLSAPVEVQSR